MPAFLPSDTRATLGQNAEKCTSRSLLLDRMVDPTAEKAARRNIFETALKKPPNNHKAKSVALLIGQNTFDAVVYAQLQSRLMVNMAGGVMENAGLCLDRFGMPYIPGSAVKGCARRAAINELQQTQSLEEKTDLLFKICLVFGWTETDWKPGRKTERKAGKVVKTEPNSDFWWAMAENTGETLQDTEKNDEIRNKIWNQVAREVAIRILNFLQVSKIDDPVAPWRDLPNFSGLVSFWPAYPIDLGTIGKVEGLPLEVPKLGELELDVVTCHHFYYYRRNLQIATDTEEPIPVVFPAVAAGHVFAFPLALLRKTHYPVIDWAQTWLKTGLSKFGIGAKTSAGYGWFDWSETIQTIAKNHVNATINKYLSELQQKKEEERRKIEEAERIRRKQEEEAALAGLSEDERADKIIARLNDQQFDSKVRAFCKDPKKGGPTEAEKRAIVRALRGPRLAYWQNFKNKATKGELAKIAQAIRELCKKMNLGKMP